MSFDPPPLAAIAVATVAHRTDVLLAQANAGALVALPEDAVLAVLGAVMRRGRLTRDLALAFLASGHEGVARALSGLDLAAGIYVGSGEAAARRGR
jgi:hypothetical protein